MEAEEILQLILSSFSMLYVFSRAQRNARLKVDWGKSIKNGAERNKRSFSDNKRESLSLSSMRIQRGEVRKEV